MPDTVIDLDDDSERWRWTCPRRHRTWEPTNGHFWCARCARADVDVCGRFHRLRDSKTGREVERDELVLLDNGTPVDVDRDASEVVA